MNRINCLSCLTTILILVGFGVGCKSAKQTESLLSEAGFKTIPAKTVQQQVQLNKLPAGKLSRVNRDGTLYFVYPDVAKNVLYVGKNDQYEDYKNDLWLSNHTSENANQAEFLDGDFWGNWGIWEAWGPLW